MVQPESTLGARQPDQTCWFPEPRPLHLFPSHYVLLLVLSFFPVCVAHLDHTGFFGGALSLFATWAYPLCPSHLLFSLVVHPGLARFMLAADSMPLFLACAPPSVPCPVRFVNGQLAPFLRSRRRRYCSLHSSSSFTSVYGLIRLGSCSRSLSRRDSLCLYSIPIFLPFYLSFCLPFISILILLLTPHFTGPLTKYRQLRHADAKASVTGQHHARDTKTPRTGHVSLREAAVVKPERSN